ncbi:TPA: hypothetical protein I3790_003635 [Enterobacter cloacae]|nr:hypothetical protein [Enterobacter cloacae]HAS1050750.1 hypothetical protein [Enterobacter cloacae]HAS1097301.1 hypothetical protein [Enterobacter cloacae]
MAPALIPTYSKDLSITPFGEKLLIETFYFFTLEAGLLRADEYIVTAGDYHYYLDVYQLGCTTDDFFQDHGEQLLDSGASMQDIVNTLLSFDMVDENKTIKIGRIQYNDFNFIEENGQTMTGKQIKSAVINPDFQSTGLARFIYVMLTKKHEYLICDNVQSVAGGALWASSILRIAVVRIYDSKTKKFVDVLGHGGRGFSGLIPWSSQNLSIDDVVRWGRALDDKNCCRHIVHVICKDRLIDYEFHDYVSYSNDESE